MTRSKVLFIAHESTRTGAPLVLLRYLQFIREEKAIEPVILIKKCGELDTEFKKLGKVFYAYQQRSSIGRSLIFKVRTRLWNSGLNRNTFLASLRVKLNKENIRLIYSNTVSNGNLLEYLKFLNCPVISHIHEADYLINMYGKSNFDKVKKITAHYVACSDFVSHTLVQNFKIEVSKISVANSPINNHYAECVSDNRDLRKEHNIKSEYKIIGASGALGWLKGSTLVIPLLQNLLTRDPNIFFIWVGGEKKSEEYEKLLFDVKKAKLEDHIYVTGSVNTPDIYYRILDVFVLLSREDSLGLVCLENAILNKPVVCFKDCGGANQFLEDWPDNIVPYLNIDAMGARISQLLQQPSLRDEIGKSLKEKVYNKYVESASFPKITGIIKSFLPVN